MILHPKAQCDDEGRVKLYVACARTLKGFETRVYSLHQGTERFGSGSYTRRKVMAVAHPLHTTYPTMAEALVAQCDLIAMQNDGRAYVIHNPQRLETLRAGRFASPTQRVSYDRLAYRPPSLD
jgi:hypothetical protein